MRVQGQFYRAHDPKWAWAPTSGDGAAIHGGRWNAKGVPALYLSTSKEAVFLEMTQGLDGRMKPMTMVQYDVDCEDVVDLTDEGVRKDLGITLRDMSGPWLWVHGPEEDHLPATWDIADALMDSGHAGILVPSFAVGAKPEFTNLVLWDWSDKLPHQVLVYDPDEQLPKDASSWEKG